MCANTSINWVWKPPTRKKSRNTFYPPVKSKMYYHETVRVPAERVGVIVGRNGRVKRRVEELTNAKIEVSSEGVVTITSPEETEDPVLA
ncbi:MAG: KH domain-containing protein, partial [Candidatus Thorarchaeota archaeon]